MDSAFCLSHRVYDRHMDADAVASDMNMYNRNSLYRAIFCEKCLGYHIRNFWKTRNVRYEYSTTPEPKDNL
jgi:hypothetical protein